METKTKDIIGKIVDGIWEITDHERKPKSHEELYTLTNTLNKRTIKIGRRQLLEIIDGKSSVSSIQSMRIMKEKKTLGWNW